jgi:hypothetical protein
MAAFPVQKKDFHMLRARKNCRNVNLIAAIFLRNVKMFGYLLSQKRAEKLLPCFLKLPAWWIAFLFTSIHCCLPSLYSSRSPVYFSFTIPLPLVYHSCTAVFTVPADGICEWFVIKILNILSRAFVCFAVYYRDFLSPV